MKEIYKKILRYIIAFIIIVFLNIGMFHLISITITPLGAVVYVVASVTAWCTICSSAGMKIISSTMANKSEKIAYGILFIFIFPLIGVLLFIYLPSPIGIASGHIAEALFSWAFGAFVASGFEFMLPNKIK